MYQDSAFSIIDGSTFGLEIPSDRDFRLLQLTDLHLGFGPFSKKKDKQALEAVTVLIERTKPDLIVLTGDSVFPYLPKAGTLNNEKEALKLLDFMDSFGKPYALIMGNHDTELGSKLKRKELGEVFKTGRYSVFTEGPNDIFGVGNYFIELRRANKLVKVLCFLDSNMYAGRWFYDGFDRIHPDQTAWCCERLSQYQKESPEIEGLAFTHMPLAEFKEGYLKMKMGDPNVTYHFGTISEEDDYFGISKLPGDFFEKAVENGTIKYIFCGHDHINNISLSYKGIQMTYGMSIDCLGYKNINKHHVQRGGTNIIIGTDNTVSVSPEPLSEYVTSHIRGMD